MKHTRGQWKVVKTHNSLEIQTEGRNDCPIIAEIVTADEIGTVGNSEEENEANARLIAAAPDMFEIILKFKEEFPDLEKIFPETYSKIKQVINKIEGKEDK